MKTQNIHIHVDTIYNLKKSLWLFDVLSLRFDVLSLSVGCYIPRDLQFTPVRWQRRTSPWLGPPAKQQRLLITSAAMQ